MFGDGDTSDAALEAKLQELCTYLLAFEERGEVFGRRNDRKIMECLAKLLSAYVEAPAETHPRLGKEKKGAAATTEPAAGAERAAVPPNVQAVPPRLHAGGASGSMKKTSEPQSILCLLAEGGASSAWALAEAGPCGAGAA